MTQRFFFRETEKSFREISGKGPDKKNYCIIRFPDVRGKFPGNFPRASGKFPRSRNSSATGPPPGLRGLTHRREFSCTGTRPMQPIIGAFGIGGQGRGLRRSGLKIILPLEFQGLPCLRLISRRSQPDFVIPLASIYSRGEWLRPILRLRAESQH